MEDKIKSARQTAILLILLLVFTFNLNSTFKANIEKYNVLWSFWIFEALKEDSKVIPKVEPDDSIYSYQDVKKTSAIFSKTRQHLKSYKQLDGLLIR